MARLKSTEVIEQERLQLWNDYQTYLRVEKSDELKEYLALKEKVESKPFQEKKKEIESLKFKGSPAEKEYKEFLKLQKNRKLLKYYDLKDSADLNRFKKIEESGQLDQLKELEQFVKGGKYKSEKVAFKKKKKADKEYTEVWEQTNTFAKHKAYLELKSSNDILFFNKFKKSKLYRNYLYVKGSSLLTQFENLKEEIESEKFKERKAYLEDDKRYEKTEDFKTLTRYEGLKSNKDIQLYLNYNDTDAFKFYREWTPTLVEDFSTLDKNRWSFVTPLAQKGPGKNFSIKNQLHYANGDDNIDTENGIFTLETKHEKLEGLYWNEEFGFVPKQFDYASGIAHTLGGFEQDYGYFEIKLKASKVKGVLSSVSLVNESEDTCIRLFTANGGAAQGGLITTNHKDKKFDPVKLMVKTKGYVIVGLTWTREKMEWTINDKYAGTISQNVPHTKMGIRIEAEVLKASQNLPHRLDIDWIKCYRRN